MAKKVDIKQIHSRQAKEHLSDMDKMLQRLNSLYRNIGFKIGVIGSTATIPMDTPFDITKHPDINKRVDRAVSDMYKSLEAVIVDGVRSQWTLANNHKDELTRVVFGSKIDSLSSADMQRYFNNHEKALEAFLKRKENGMNLSQRVWKYADTTKVEIESALELGMKTGESAQVMAKNLMQYLKKPDALFRRIRDKEGELHLSGNAIQYHPGQGVYRSSYMNAKRLAATETNMAYDTADHLRVQDMDFVVGIKISLSNNHTCLNSKGLPEPFTDICDDLQGKYPKDFKFTGWHPFCYDDKTEVLTKRGWLKFVDVRDDDLIFSLNPETRSVEWAGISNQFSWEHKGNMIRFYNRSLDMVVTPDHPVVYVSKSDGRIRKAQAKDYRMGLGAIYRSSKYCADDVESVTIGGRVVPFDAFAEFMGYWLADGSLLRDYQVVISQEDEDHRTDMLSCIGAMGFKAHDNKGKISFYDKSFNSYLKQFGHAYDKYVPDLIKNSSPRQIKIFLDAFISCDGYVREGKAFVGNRGSVAIPSKERVYFSSSLRMQADLGECLVKIGKRPSYRLNSKAGTVTRFRNGDYATNYDSYTISECNSATASVFTKEIVPYDGMVYDVELSKNHIMYLRRSGKCYWGSNCRCISTTILKTEDELIRDMDGEDRGSVNEVKDVPEGFKKWLADNEKRAEYSYSMPYFIKDNLGTPYIPEKWAGLYGSKMPYDTFEEYDKARKYNAVFGHFSPEQKRNHKELSEKLPVSQGKVMPFGQADSEHPNPHYNDNGSDQKGYHHNCQTCTVAYELRRRGFNIEALPNPVVGTYKGEDDREVWKFFRDRNMSQDERFLAPKTGVGVSWNMSKGVLDTNAKRLRFIESETTEEGRYEIYFRWAHRGKDRDKLGGAHVIIAEKQGNGNLVFYDPQNGRHWAKGGDDFKEFHKRYLDIVSCMDGNAIGVLRIDNKLINPKFAERFIRSGDNSTLARAKARHDARTAEDIADIKRRWTLRKAENRHAARTQAQIDAIKKQYEFRNLSIECAADVRKALSGIADVDFSLLDRLESTASWKELRAEAVKLDSIKLDLQSLKYISNGLDEAKTYGYKAVMQADAEIDGVLSKWLSKYGYSSLDTAPLGHLRNKLEFEISSPTFDYANKALVDKVIKEKITIIDKKIKWDELVSQVDSLKEFTTKSTDYKKLIKKVESAVLTNDYDKLKEAIEKAEAKMQELIEEQFKQGDNVKTALNIEYKGGAVGKDLTASFDTRKLVSADPYQHTFTNNIARMQGFDAPAKLVSAAEFKTLEAGCGEVFYRTVNSATFKGVKMSSAEFAAQIYKADLLELNGPGGRVHGDGMYVATSAWDGYSINKLTDNLKKAAKEESLYYGNGQHTLSEMTWTRKPKVIKYTELTEKWHDLTEEQRARFDFNMNTYGCALGYDAMLCRGPNYMVIWNRSIIAVKKK